MQQGERPEYIRYYENHQCCPNCGSSRIESTSVGYIMTDAETFKDDNVSKCSTCKWAGVVHELEPCADDK